MSEIKLLKRTPVERLLIANTLIESVIRESDLKLVNTELIKCRDSVTNCIQIMCEAGEVK